LALNLNGVSKSVPFAVAVEGNRYRFTGSIGFADFAMQAQHTALHEACAALHTGKDGKSVTWDTVELLVEAQVSCQ
jgi:hypothetical protein